MAAAPILFMAATASPAFACGAAGEPPCPVDKLAFCGSAVLCPRSKQVCQPQSPRLDQKGLCAPLAANDIPEPQVVNFQDTGGGVVSHGFVVEIDLSKVNSVVPRRPQPDPCLEGNLSTVVPNPPDVPTDNWVDDPAYGLRLAVNGSYFDVSQTTPWTEKCTHIFGFTMSDGVEVRPQEMIQASGSPPLAPGSLLFYGPQASGKPVAEIQWGDKFPIPPAVVNAISGVQLVQNNNYVGDGKTGPEATAARPRTAVGLKGDNTTLIVVTVSGNDPTGRTTLAGLASYLISLGAANAINLDGGGSASFYYRGDDGNLITSIPSDTPTGYDGPLRFYRPVGNFLGFQ